MKNFFSKYSWLFKAIGAAVLIALGIAIWIKDGFFEGVIVIFTGICLSLLGIVRVFPLVKTTKNVTAKWLKSIDIILEILAGLAMVFLWVGLEQKNQELVKTIYPYVLGSVLFISATIYFYCSIMLKESSDQWRFWVNIVFAFVGTMGIVSDYLTPNALVIILMIIAFLCGAYSGFDSFFTYRKYRESLPKKEEKEITIEEVKEEEAIPPILDEKKEHEETTVS